LRRTTPFALLAVLNLLCFGTASIFVSKIARGASDAVLVRSENCGYHSFKGKDGNDWEFKSLVTMSRAAEYAQACYGTASESGRCIRFVKRRIGWEMRSDVSCPFEEKICRGQSVVLDTGLMDSHVDLGINGKVEERIAMRRVTTCSLLRMRDYTTFKPEELDQGWGGNESIYKVNYGETGEGTNYTYWYNERARSLIKNYHVE
jgi:hypothetical protein